MMLLLLKMHANVFLKVIAAMDAPFAAIIKLTLRVNTAVVATWSSLQQFIVVLQDAKEYARRSYSRNHLFFCVQYMLFHRPLDNSLYNIALVGFW